MRVGILTGGGDCRALNAVIRATVKTSVGFGWEVSGIEEGFDGLVHSRVRRMNMASVSGILHLGGTILGTTNAANPFSYPILAEGGKAVARDISDIEFPFITRYYALHKPAGETALAHHNGVAEKPAGNASRRAMIKEDEHRRWDLCVSETGRGSQGFSPRNPEQH